VLDLASRRPVAPVFRKIGDARHAWESDDAVVVKTDTLLTLSLERRACYRLRMWRRPGAAI
jgi:hypothetical protein